MLCEPPPYPSLEECVRRHVARHMRACMQGHHSAYASMGAMRGRHPAYACTQTIRARPSPGMYRLAYVYH